jgi:hypothetical protein
MNSGPPLEEPALRAPPASLSELPADGEASALQLVRSRGRARSGRTAGPGVRGRRPIATVARGGITIVIVALDAYLLHDIFWP